ncbi:MAG: hypothetical protein DCF25_11410 [Leptolyngbya foveolarum]|uniref:PIN domain-containing protein n=1 Tax=Leptolyngbya foveolarum TaxID=47253 RepID=A0A2W4U7N9_9CYAN|nr:MAG: hypothetical protein DCF25_11410 [Leptolyngbya foveolarum]
MIDPIESLLRRYFSKGILVDTNILLLLFVGELGRERITKFGRTEQFTPNDYDILIDLLQRFTVIATTPNILTEVNSLLNKLGEPAREVFAKGLVLLEETYIPSREIASLDWSFLKYGLTDCGIAEAAQNKYLVLTDDLKVAVYFNQRGIDTINFNNLRSF